MEADKSLELHIPHIFGQEKVAMDFAASAVKIWDLPGSELKI